MLSWKAACAAGLLLAAGAALARPVSWPGGWTAVQEFDPMSGSLLLHYTPNRHWSVGARAMRMREAEWSLAGAQATWLARRWNMPGAQANLYVSGLAGGAWRDGGSLGPAGFAEVQADWENRRVMLMGMARLTHAEGIETTDMQMLRAGWAPFAGDYGDVHLWLFGQAMRDSGSQDMLQPALVVRIFYRVFLLEAGLTDRGGLIFNSTIRF